MTTDQPDGFEEEVDVTLNSFGTDAIYAYNGTGGGEQAFQAALEKAKAAIIHHFTQEVTKGRNEGFVGSFVACSFDENCKHCHANELTLKYLAADGLKSIEAHLTKDKEKP